MAYPNAADGMHSKITMGDSAAFAVCFVTDVLDISAQDMQNP